MRVLEALTPVVVGFEQLAAYPLADPWRVRRKAFRVRRTTVQGLPLAMAIDEPRDRVIVVGSKAQASLLDLHGTTIASLPLQPPEVLATLTGLSPREERQHGALAGGIHPDAVFTISMNGRVHLFDDDGKLRADRCFVATLADSTWCGADRCPDGRVAFGALDGTVALYSASGELQWHKKVHNGPLRFVRFAPGGRQLLAATGLLGDWIGLDGWTEASDHSATVLDRDGNVHCVLNGHRDWVHSACWSDDGAEVLTASIDREARIWHVGETVPGAPVRVTVLPHERSLRSAQFFPDGKRVLAGAFAGQAGIWNTFRRARSIELRGDFAAAYCWTTCAAGNQVLVGSLDKQLLLFDSQSRWRAEWDCDELAQLTAWDANGKSVWTVGRQGLVRQWRPGHREPLRSFDLATTLRRDELILCGAWWPERHGPVCQTSHHRILLIDPNREQVTQLQAHSGAVQPPDTPCWLRPHGDSLLFGDWFGQRVCIYTDEQTRSIQLSGGVADGAISPDGTWAAVGNNGELTFVDIARGEVTGKVSVPDTISGIAIAPTGDVVVACQTRWLGRVTRSGTVRQLADLGVQLFRMCLSPDGQRIAVAGGDGRVRVLTSDGELKVTLPASDLTWAMAFSPDSSHLLVPTRTGEVHVWPMLLEESGADVLQGSPYGWAVRRAPRERR